MNKKYIYYFVGTILIIAIIVVINYIFPFQKKEINIGAILPLTGKLSQYAEEAKQGMELALENAKVPIKIIYEDSQSETKQGVNALQKLLTNKISILITGGSNISLAISPLSNENKILQMAVFSSVTKYTSPNDYTFRVTTRSEIENQTLIDWTVNHSIKSTAIIYSNDEWGLGHYDYIRQQLEISNISITNRESFLNSDADTRTQLLKIKKHNPEAVFLIAQGKNAGLILKQAKELNLTPQFLGVRAIETNELIPIAGDSAEGVIYPYSFDPTSKEGNIKDFVAKYKNKYSKLPTTYSAEGYDAMNLLIKAINTCQGDNADCLKQNISNTKNYQGILGNISFDNNGDVYIKCFLKTVKEGQFVKY